MYSDRSGMFEDFNFKLVVINSLLATDNSFGASLEKLADNEPETDEINTSVLEFLQDLVLTQDDLDEVTDLVFDGGEDIYMMLYPDWDGEDDTFDVTSIGGIEKLKNLTEVEYISMISDELIAEIENMGIEIM